MSWRLSTDLQKIDRRTQKVQSLNGPWAQESCEDFGLAFKKADIESHVLRFGRYK
jgi:hypothetical protein